MPTFETNQSPINLNAALQDAIDAGMPLVLTVGNNYSKLSVETAEEKESADAR